MDSQLNLFEQEKRKTSNSQLPSDFFQLEEILEKDEKKLLVYYGFGKSKFGKLIEAYTEKGICYLAFYEDKNQATLKLKEQFPKAEFVLNKQEGTLKSACYFIKDWSQLPPLKLLLKGTSFQLKVWKALIQLPMGKTTSYHAIAKQIEQPKASRAVGSAIGENLIAFLIPCHRVLQKSGKIGGYRWGESRKRSLLDWEAGLV